MVFSKPTEPTELTSTSSSDGDRRVSTFVHLSTSQLLPPRLLSPLLPPPPLSQPPEQAGHPIHPLFPIIPFPRSHTREPKKTSVRPPDSFSPSPRIPDLPNFASLPSLPLSSLLFPLCPSLCPNCRLTPNRNRLSPPSACLVPKPRKQSRLHACLFMVS